jgi:hypothetical protein
MTNHHQAAIEARLERYAAQQGDPTAAVLAAFYARHPEARISFARHAPLDPARLETEMVGNSLYYIMTLFTQPVEARIYFDTSVPHHRVALNVPPDWYRAFLEATIDVIEAGAPALDGAEVAAWRAVREGLVGLVERNRFV